MFKVHKMSRQELIEAMTEYAIAWVSEDEMAGCVTDRESLYRDMLELFALGRTEDDLIMQVIETVMRERYH